MADRKLWFVHFAQWVSHATGRPIAFLLAFSSIVVWGFTGPLFGFSDTWQLVINTATTIITFLMVFVIQNTQNRDTAAIQVKLDELIRATQGAHNAILDHEELDEEQLREYLRRYEALAAAARQRLRDGKLDTDAPDIKDLPRSRSSRGG
jgi:low affinity Fe/Cu permease